ncbi:hypothetical protein P9112_010650 [Eukaryota sp. TZLM1-RC]
MTSSSSDSRSALDAHIIRKYEVLNLLGKGAYGLVWKVTDKKTGQLLALKKIFDAFQNDTDAQRTFREIMFLQQLNHPNIVRLLNVLKADNDYDIYLVFDYLETDLHTVIRSNILEPIHKQYITFQIIRALRYIHSGKLIHRDMKPSNVLLNADCTVKLADFGLARSLASTPSGRVPILTDYVATRWYRSPEILLGSSNYSEGADMWAVGCILAEILLGEPVFPGKSTMNQLSMIAGLIGPPSEEDIASMKSQYAASMLRTLTTVRKVPMEVRFPNAPVEAIDLMKKLIVFNPTKRLSAVEAMKHPFVSIFNNSLEDIVYEGDIKISMDDNRRYNLEEYRTKLYAEIVARKKEMRRLAMQRHKRQGGNSSVRSRSQSNAIGRSNSRNRQQWK